MKCSFVTIMSPLLLLAIPVVLVVDARIAGSSVAELPFPSSSLLAAPAPTQQQAQLVTSSVFTIHSFHGHRKLGSGNLKTPTQRNPVTNVPVRVFQMKGTTKCLSFTTATPYDPVVLEECDDNNTDQKWHVDSNGGLRNYGRNRCLQMEGQSVVVGESKGPQLAPCKSDQTPQMWQFEGIPEGILRGRYGSFRDAVLGVTNGKLRLQSYTSSPKTTWVDRRDYDNDYIVLANGNCFGVDYAHDGERRNAYPEIYWYGCDVSRSEQNWWMDDKDRLHNGLYQDMCLASHNKDGKGFVTASLELHVCSDEGVQKWEFTSNSMIRAQTSSLCISNEYPDKEPQLQSCGDHNNRYFNEKWAPSPAPTAAPVPVVPGPASIIDGDPTIDVEAARNVACFDLTENLLVGAHTKYNDANTKAIPDPVTKELYERFPVADGEGGVYNTRYRDFCEESLEEAKYVALKYVFTCNKLVQNGNDERWTVYVEGHPSCYSNQCRIDQAQELLEDYTLKFTNERNKDEWSCDSAKIESWTNTDGSVERMDGNDGTTSFIVPNSVCELQTSNLNALDDIDHAMYDMKPAITDKKFLFLLPTKVRKVEFSEAKTLIVLCAANGGFFYNMVKEQRISCSKKVDTGLQPKKFEVSKLSICLAKPCAAIDAVDDAQAVVASEFLAQMVAAKELESDMTCIISSAWKIGASVGLSLLFPLLSAGWHLM